MTAPLAKATLQEIDVLPAATPSQPIAVQFNPTSLRLQMANNVDMKKASGKRPVVQYDGTSSATLSFDLIFDTSDEGTTQQPVDVRTRTRLLERFVLPAKRTKSAPPLVRFQYGSFALTGVMTSLNQDFDLFSTAGVPLRARLAVSIKEHMPEYEAGLLGPAADTGAGARDDQGLLPAGTRAAHNDRTATAVAGESAPDFAGRMGLDPADWRALGLGGQDPLRLTAGATVDFSASLSTGPSLSAAVTAGVTVGTSAVEPAPDGGDPRSVTSAGGLQNALDRRAGRRAALAADAQRAAFGGPSTVGPGAGEAAGPPDRRGLTYGTGVPLRPLMRPPARGDVGLPVTDDPTVAPWLALSAPHTARTKPRRPCTCAARGGSPGGCRCRGGAS